MVSEMFIEKIIGMIGRITRFLVLVEKVPMFKAIMYIKDYKEKDRYKPFIVLFGLMLVLSVIVYAILSVLPGVTIPGAIGLTFIFFIFLFMDYVELWANSQWLCREVAKIDDFTLNGM